MLNSNTDAAVALAAGCNPIVEADETWGNDPYDLLADRYLSYIETFYRCPENVAAIMNRHILPRWEFVRLGEIKPQDVAQWLTDMTDDGLAPATIEKILAIFSRSLDAGRRWNVPGTEINPARSVARNYVVRRPSQLTAA